MLSPATSNRPNLWRQQSIIDPAGRRIGKQVSGQLSQGFLYDSRGRVLAELDASGNVISQFVYASRSNIPDLMLHGGKTYRLISDYLGSVRLVVNSSTSEVVQQLDYDVWGVVANDANPGFQPFAFAGGLYDSDTKLIRFGARDYDPSIGRWVSKDPILFGGAQVNLFVYVGDDPVNFVDPSGEILNVLVGAGIGAGIGALSAYATGGDVWAGAAAGAVTGGFAGLTGGMSLAGQILGGVGAGLTGVGINEAVRFLDGSSSVGPSALAVGAVAGASGPFAGILFRELGQPGLSGLGEFAVRRVACGISTAGVGIETKRMTENQ